MAAVQMKAGRMQLVDKLLKADSRKGLISVIYDQDNMLTHFQWEQRGVDTTEPELDVVVFPDECSFEKVPQPSARVFQLKFSAEPDRNVFFWSQEPDASKDDQHVAAFNTALNSPPAPEEEDVEMEDSQLVNVAQPSSQVQTAAAASGVNASQLAAVLGSIFQSGGSAQAIAQQQATGPSLREVVSSDKALALLEDPQIIKRLAETLPEEQRSVEWMRAIVTSPQFKSQLNTLGQALNSGMANAAHFGLEPGFGVVGFLASLQKEADKKNTDKEG